MTQNVSALTVPRDREWAELVQQAKREFEFEGNRVKHDSTLPHILGNNGQRLYEFKAPKRVG